MAATAESRTNAMYDSGTNPHAPIVSGPEWVWSAATMTRDGDNAGRAAATAAAISLSPYAPSRYAANIPCVSMLATATGMSASIDHRPHRDPLRPRHPLMARPDQRLRQHRAVAQAGPAQVGHPAGRDVATAAPTL